LERVRTDGSELEYEVVGTGEPVVFIHGAFIADAFRPVLRRWVARIRQIVESVYEKLFNAFGLWRERPHELQGLRARLAARVALHNFCIWLNDQLGRPRLAFADLLGW